MLEKFTYRKNIENNIINNLALKNTMSYSENISRGDIVYVDLGEGYKYETQGVRLCIVLQNNVGNKYSGTTIVAVLSDKIIDLATHYTIENYTSCGLDRKYQICLEYIRTISKGRIMSTKPEGFFDIDLIKDKLLFSLGFTKESTYRNRRNNIMRDAIYYVDLGEGEGSEQCGKRPCIVLQNNIGNAYSESTIVAVISSKIKNLPTHILIENFKESGLDKPSQIYLEQIRSISKKRITWGKPIGRFDINSIKNKFLLNFGFETVDIFS